MRDEQVATTVQQAVDLIVGAARSEYLGFPRSADEKKAEATRLLLGALSPTKTQKED